MSEKKYLIIDTRPYGLFSIFLHTLDCLKWAEDNKYIPYIRWGYGRVDPNRYRDGAKEAMLQGHPKYVKDKNNFVTSQNIINNTRPCLYINEINDNPWEAYFEKISEESIEDVLRAEYDVTDIFLTGELDFDLDNKFLIRNLHSYDSLKLWSLVGTEKETQHRKDVFNIYKKYVNVREEITEKVEKFYNNNNNGEELIGVHVRGTDKRNEFPFKQLEIEDYIDNIKEIYKHKPNCKIYVASDNNEAIIKISEHFGKNKVFAYPSLRMKDFYGNKLIVFAEGLNKKLHGEQTLIETLLLSKAQYIIGTDSNLTAAAAYFNPEAKLIYLDRNNGKRN